MFRLFFIIFTYSQIILSDLNHKDFLSIKSGERKIDLVDNFFIKDDVAYVHDKIIQELFKFQSTYNPVSKKYILRDSRNFIQLVLDNHYVLFLDMLYYVQNPIIELNDGFYLSEKLISTVISRSVLEKITFYKNTPKQKSSKHSAQHVCFETIIIDPGHGGEDEGAVYKNFKEKDIVLDIATKLKHFIQGNTSIKAYLTRETDVFVPLRARTKMGDSLKANLFLSIHLNSSKNPKASGFEVFLLDPDTTDEDAALIAKVENSVLEYENQKPETLLLDDIFIDISISSYKQDSLKLAELLMKNINVLKYRGIKQAPFIVLTGLNMPSVLLELGFVSNETDRNILMSKSNVNKMIKNISYSIIQFKEFYDSKYCKPMLEND